MSPRYEVEISELYSKNLRRFVREFGGKIDLIPESLSGEAQEEWTRQVSIARKLVESFEHPKNEIVNQIGLGVRHLMQNFTEYHRVMRPKLHMKTNIDLDDARKNLVRIFSLPLTDEMLPQFKSKRKTGKATTFSRIPQVSRQGSNLMTPKEIIFVIERLGLSDGVPKPINVISRMYKWQSPGAMYSVYWALRHDSSFTELVWEKAETNKS